MSKTKKSTHKRKRSYTISNTRQKRNKCENISNSNESDKIDKLNNSENNDENESSILKNIFDKFIALFQ